MNRSDVEIKLLELLTKQTEDVSEIKVVLAENTTSLKEHIRRTELLEKKEEQLDSRIKPLEVNQAMWAGVNKALVILGLIIGALTAAYKLVTPSEASTKPVQTASSPSR